MKQNNFIVYRNGKLHKGNIQEGGIYKMIDKRPESYNVVHGLFKNNVLKGYMTFSKDSLFISHIQIGNRFIIDNFGIIIFKNGNIFVGNVNLPDQIGYTECENFRYFGFINNGQFHGFGKYQDKIHKYIGGFIKDKKNGFFEIYKNDKLYIKANYVDDKITQGILYCDQEDEVLKIESNQFDGLNPQGVSCIYLKDDSHIICDISQIYKNNSFQENVQYNGFIISNVENQSFYTGYIKNFKMDGYGSLKKNGFIKYEGSFKDGKISGLGKMFQKNNHICIGNFENGICEGYGILIQDNNIFYGKYQNGRMSNKYEINLRDINLQDFQQ